MKFHRHQDGFVYIRNADESVVYSGTIEDFQTDSSTVLPELPEGMTSFVYDGDTKIASYYDARGNAFPIEGIFDDVFCDGVLSQVNTICSVQVQRVDAAAAAVTAGLPKPTPTPTPIIPVTGL